VSDVLGITSATLADVQVATVNIPPLSAGAGFLSKGAGIGSLLFAGAANQAEGVSLLSGDVPAKLGAVMLGGLTSMTARQRALDYLDALRAHALAVGAGLYGSR